MKLTHFINGNLNDTYSNLINEEKNSDKKFKFLLDNITNYIYITDRLIFIRETDDYRFEISISDNPTCNLFLKNENKKLNINIVQSSYEVKDNCIDFNYVLDTDNDEHHIILEIGE